MHKKSVEILGENFIYTLIEQSDTNKEVTTDITPM